MPRNGKGKQMPRSGSGQYTPTSGSWTNPVNGQLATSGDWTALLNDISAALTQSLSADGQTPVTGNLNLGNNKITSLSAGTGSGNALEFSQLFNQGTEQDLASAATTDIGAQLTNFLRITGTTTITSFGTNYKGPRFLRFEGAVTLTNGSALTLPGGANITTAAGDCLIAIPRATLGTADGWVVVAYQKNAVPGTPDGSITTAKLADSSVTTPKIADANITTTKIAAGAVTPDKLSSTAQYMGFKNRIINGDMRIDQRNAGASSTAGNGTYAQDRWLNYFSGVTFTTQQSSTVPAGFAKSIVYTVSSGSAAPTYAFFRQIIEGNNVADLSWGTASASAISISFWVRSSVTGIYSLSVTNGASNRCYAAQYTINSANTWEQKTVTIAGDTTGTWATDNTAGLTLSFNLGSPSGRLIAAGSWGTTYGDGATGSTGAATFANTNGATFYITGVQLEKGSTATSFDYRPYGTELALCQRYCYRISGDTDQLAGLPFTTYGSTQGVAQVQFPVTMRSAPSLSFSGTARIQAAADSANFTSGVSIATPTTTGTGVLVTGTSGMTTSASGHWQFRASGSYLLFSAEL